jgi:MFS transporter, TsgA protein
MTPQKIKSFIFNHNNNLFFLSLFIMLLITGMIGAFFSPVLIDLSKYFHTSISKLGLIFPFINIGMMIAVIINLFIYGNFNFKKFFTIIYILIFSAYFIIFINRNIIILFFCVLIVAFSFSAIQVNLYNLISNLIGRNRKFFISLTTFFAMIAYFSGAIISPFIIKINLNWKFVFLILSIISFLNFIFFIFIKNPEIKKLERESIKINFKKLLNNLDRHRSITIILVINSAVLAALMSGLSDWMPSFFRAVRNLNLQSVGISLALFWFFSAVSRIFFGYFFRKTNLINLSLFLVTAFFINFAITVYLKNIFLVLFYILSIFFMTSLWPNTINMICDLINKKQNLVISTSLISYYIGSICSNFFITNKIKSGGLGFIPDYLLILGIIMVLLIVSIFIINRATGRIALKEAEGS